MALYLWSRLAVFGWEYIRLIALWSDLHAFLWGWILPHLPFHLLALDSTSNWSIFVQFALFAGEIDEWICCADKRFSHSSICSATRLPPISLSVFPIFIRLREPMIEGIHSKHVADVKCTDNISCCEILPFPSLFEI